MGGGLVLVMVIVALRDRVLGWNFSSLNTTTEDVTVLHVSVYYMRAYVSIKSEDRVPTLVESMWPESVLSSPVQVYAGKRFHHLSTRPSFCCRRLVQSYRTAVDPRGNLWIVDNGSEESGCRPKLLVMSFFNQEVQRKQLTTYSPNSITDLILDMRPILGIRSNTTRAYLSVRNKDYILAYSLTHNEVRRLKIQPSHVDLFSQPDPMSITAMAMLTLGTGREVALLYDNIEKALYYVDLRIGRSQGQLYATQLGCLLGRTRGIVVDRSGQMYYHTDRDGALFRWNTKSKLSAEYHEVLHFQTATAAQVLIGTQGAIYLVNEKPIDEFEVVHSQKILDHYSLRLDEVRCSFCE